MCLPAVTYKTSLLTLIHSLAVQYLVDNLGYPASISHSLKFDPDFAIRGLHYDRSKGLLMKIDQYAKIQPGYLYCFTCSHTLFIYLHLWWHLYTERFTTAIAHFPTNRFYMSMAAFDYPLNIWNDNCIAWLIHSVRLRCEGWMWSTSLVMYVLYVWRHSTIISIYETTTT